LTFTRLFKLISLLLLRTSLFRHHALRFFLLRLTSLRWFCRTHTVWSCALTGFLLLTRPCRCHVFRYHDLGGLTRFCRSHVLWHDNLTGKFLLTLFYRRRVFGYDDLAYLTCLCRCHVLGHHGLIRAFRFCRCHVLRHDHLFRLTWLCRCHALRHDDLTGRPRLTRPCRCYMLGYHDRSGLTGLCGCRMLWHNDLTGKFLLTLFYRRRMFGYDDLAYLTCLCRCHVLGHHGLIRAFRLCRCHVLRHDDLFRLTWLCRCHVLRHDDLSRLGWRDSPSGTLNLLLLKRYFRFGPVHLIGGYDVVRCLRRFNPGLAVDLPLFGAPRLLLDHGSVLFPAPLNDRLIVLDSIDHGIVRLLFHRDVGVIVPLLVRRVIVDHRVIDHRRRTVVVDDGGAVYVGHPHIPVIVYTVKIVLGDHDGVVCISIIAKVDVDLRDVDVGHDHVTRASPATVAVVRLAWRQRHPPHIGAMMNP